MTDGENGRSVRSDEQGAGPGVSPGERPRLSGGHQRDVAFVALLRADDPSAFGLLFDTWIDPVYDRISHRSFTTADVADLSANTFGSTHRRLIEQSTDDPFRVVLFRGARQETVAAADRRVDLHMPVGPYAEDRLVRGADAGGLATDPAVAALLWQAADVLGDQARDVLDLHHRHDFSPVEIAAVMNLTPEAIEDILRKVPKGLTAVVRSMVVWRQGAPAHDELATALAGVHSFDTTTVRTIAEHQRTCDACREAGKLSVDPLAVFKAIPLAVAPVGFKEIVVDRLHQDGLPIEGSVSYRPGSDNRGNGAAAAGLVGAGAASAAAFGSMSDSTPKDESPEAVEPTAPEAEADASTSAAAAGAAGAAALGADTDSVDDESSPWDPLVRPASTVSSDRDKAKAKAAIAATAAATAAAAARATAAAAEEVAPASAAGAAPSAASTAPAWSAPAWSAPASSAPASSAPTSPIAASSAAYKPTPAPAPAPSSGGDEPGSGSNRKLLYVGIAVAAVILLIGGFLLTQGGGSKDKTSLASDAPSSSTTVSTTAPSSSALVTSTTVPVTGETTPPDTGSTDSSVAPTTKAPQATITVPGQVVTTTTAVPFPKMDGTTMVLSTTVVTSGVDQAPTLSWNVKSDKPVTVTISGPNLSSTDLSGGPRAVCPGSIDSGGVCTATNGVYAYTLKATDSEGRMFYTKTVQFTVRHN